MGVNVGRMWGECGENVGECGRMWENVGECGRMWENKG